MENEIYLYVFIICFRCNETKNPLTIQRKQDHRLKQKKKKTENGGKWKMTENKWLRVPNIKIKTAHQPNQKSLNKIEEEK